MQSVLRIHPSDDLIVALRDLRSGEVVPVNGAEFRVTDAIPAKQKFAARELAVGDLATMYGVTVGCVTRPIHAGGLVSTANLRHATSETNGKQRETAWTPPDAAKWCGRTFDGFRRPNGRAGTAN